MTNKIQIILSQKAEQYRRVVEALALILEAKGYHIHTIKSTNEESFNLCVKRYPESFIKEEDVLLIKQIWNHATQESGGIATDPIKPVSSAPVEQ